MGIILESLKGKVITIIQHPFIGAIFGIAGKTFDNMKRLGFRAAYLSTDKNVEARAKIS
jgi:hypothetical protein